MEHSNDDRFAVGWILTQNHEDYSLWPTAMFDKNATEIIFLDIIESPIYPDHNGTAASFISQSYTSAMFNINFGSSAHF